MCSKYFYERGQDGNRLTDCDQRTNMSWICILYYIGMSHLTDTEEKVRVAVSFGMQIARSRSFSLMNTMSCINLCFI